MCRELDDDSVTLIMVPISIFLVFITFLVGLSFLQGKDKENRLKMAQDYEQCVKYKKNEIYCKIYLGIDDK